MEKNQKKHERKSDKWKKYVSLNKNWERPIGKEKTGQHLE